MRFRRGGVEGRWVGLDARAQQLQTNVLTHPERTWAIDGWSRLSERVRFVVVRARRQDRLDLGSQQGLSLARHGHVQQAWRGRLAELLRDEQTLWTPGLEGHAQ